MTRVPTLRDRTLSPRIQVRFAANLAASEIVPIDTGHTPRSPTAKGCRRFSLSNCRSRIGQVGRVGAGLEGI
jgi:hypothetical protein